jgi:hypothetical protein
MQMRSQEHHVHTRDGFEGDANTIDGTCRVRARRTEAKKSRAERRPARALAENVNCQILACERFVRASLLPTLRIYSTWTCSPSIALQHLAAIIRVIGSFFGALEKSKLWDSDPRNTWGKNHNWHHRIQAASFGIHLSPISRLLQPWP